MDSLSPTSLAYYRNLPGLEIRLLPAEKDETDLEAAIYAALDFGPEKITIIGGLGGRIDHTLGNLYLLAAPRVRGSGVKVNILGENEAIWLLEGGGELLLEGKSGDLLSLIPFQGEAVGIKTHNLYYPLNNETLIPGLTRGISNIFTTSNPAVSLSKGLLLVIHTWKN